MEEEGGGAPRERYRLSPWASGGMRVDVDNVAEALDWAELIPDAHLAALAMQYGLVLCSTDADFERFPRLAWKNPLAE